MYDVSGKVKYFICIWWQNNLKQGKETASEAEEWPILVQRGYYNNPVPSYFSTSHLLILIQTRISISQLWTIIRLVVDYF